MTALCSITASLYVGGVVARTNSIGMRVRISAPSGSLSQWQLWPGADGGFGGGQGSFESVHQSPTVQSRFTSIVCKANKPRKRSGTGYFAPKKKQAPTPRPRPKKKEKPPAEEAGPSSDTLDLSKFTWTRHEPEPEKITPEQRRTNILEAMDLGGVNAVSDKEFIEAFDWEKPDPFFDRFDEAVKPKYKGAWSMKKAREMKKKQKAERERADREKEEVFKEGRREQERAETAARKDEQRRKEGGPRTVEPEVVGGPGSEEPFAPQFGGFRDLEGGRARLENPPQEEDDGLEWGVSDETFAQIQREFGADLDELQGASDSNDSELRSEAESDDGDLHSEAEEESEGEEIQSLDDVDLTDFADGYLDHREAYERQRAEEEARQRTEMPADMARILSWPRQQPDPCDDREFVDENGYSIQDENEHEDPEYESQLGFSLEWFHEKMGWNAVFRSSFPPEQQQLARQVLASHLKRVRKMEPGLADLVASKCNGFLDREMLRKPEKGSPAENEPDLERRMELCLKELTKHDFLSAYFEAIGLDQERTKLGVVFQPVSMTVPLAHRAVAYLREGLGFSDKEIHMVIVDSAHLLRWQPDAWRKRREFFGKIGWNEKELIQKDPAAYSKDVDSQLVPMYDLLKKSGVKDVNLAVKEAPILLGKNTVHGLAKKVELLRASSFTPDDLNKLVVNDPAALALNIEVAFPPLLKILDRWGFTERQKVDVVAGWPEVLTQRRIFFNDRLKFLIEERGRTPEEIAHWPQVLWYSVIERLQPCFGLAETYEYVDKGLQYILQPPSEEFTSQRHKHTWLGDPKELMDYVMKNGLDWRD